MSTLPIPEKSMIDIHMHLLPDVDDGAQDLEMAPVMMIRAKEQGISQMIATPHSEAFDYSQKDISGILTDGEPIPKYGGIDPTQCV